MENSLPLLQSLFCKQGLDNRQRYGAIVLASHLLFFFLWLVFSQSPIILSLFTTIFTAILFLSSKRRLQDAGLSNYWVMLPSLFFAIAAILLINIDSHWTLLTFIPSLATASYLISQPTRNNQQYTLGYAGPIDLSAQAIKSVHERNKIEPSFDGPVDHLQFAEVNHRPSSTFQQTSSFQPFDLTSWFKDNILSIKHIKIIAPAFLVLVLIAFIYVLAIDNAPEQSSVEQTKDEAEVIKPQSPIDEMLHVVAMPDDFELASNEFNGIKLRWQADILENKTLWDITTATGDKSCTNLTFNQGSKYRPIQVNVVNNGTYIATFSPLDTEKIIKDLAYKNTFSLCGYDFSLKGSQAAIGKHNFYAKWL